VTPYDLDAFGNVGPALTPMPALPPGNGGASLAIDRAQNQLYLTGPRYFNTGMDAVGVMAATIEMTQAYPMQATAMPMAIVLAR
jgi:hypothetical protein